MTTKIIVAVSPSGVIGLNNGIPWRKSADLKRFKSVTMGGTLVMGRKTFDSMGRRSLPGRSSIVISRSTQDGVCSSPSVEHAIALGEAKGEQVWVIGGWEIYALALPLVDEIDLTLVTDYEDPEDSSWNPCDFTYFWPFKSGMPGFKLTSEEVNADDPTLVHKLYVRV
jgi:dihydrofolate reductase